MTDSGVYVPPFIAKREREIEGYESQAAKHDAMAAEYRAKVVEIRAEIDDFKTAKGMTE